MWSPILVLICIPAIIGNVVMTRSPEEKAAEDIMMSARARMEAHWLHLRQIFLSSDESNHTSHLALEKSFQDYRAFTIALAQNLSNLLGGYSDFKNVGLKRQVKLLSHLKISGLNDEDYNRSQKLLDIMGNYSQSIKICPPQNCEQRITLPEIEHRIAAYKEMPQYKLLYYWKEWRNVISQKARQDFLEYVALYRKAASLNGHSTPSKTWYLDFEENNFMDELTTAMRELLPMYKEIHAYMRFIYHQQHGGDLDPYYGPIPDHIMDQIIAQAWAKDPLFDPPYPESEQIDLKNKVKTQVGDPHRALEKAASFFESLGLRKLPQEFWNKYVRQKAGVNKKGESECKADVYSFPPDVGIKYCPNITYKGFLQMHGKMGEIYYNWYRGVLPYGLNEEAFCGLSRAFGEVAIISASGLQHLRNINFVDNYSSEGAFNRLFRMAVHTIFTLRRYFVMEKFWVNALDHKEDAYPDKLNCAFWNVQLEYGGVVPPEERSENFFDPGYKFYRGINDNSPTTANILSELLGYHIYRSICIKCGQYRPGDKNYPLHNCDIYTCSHAGKLLGDMMSLGSSKPWRDVLEIGTDERRISASALLEYYEPVYEWVKQKNIDNGVTVGWDVDKTKC